MALTAARVTYFVTSWYLLGAAKVTVVKPPSMTPLWNARNISDAGIAIGDVITEVNGAPISTGSDLAGVLEKAEEGARLRIRIYHQGRPRVVALTLRAWEAPE